MFRQERFSKSQNWRHQGSLGHVRKNPNSDAVRTTSNNYAGIDTESL